MQIAIEFQFTLLFPATKHDPSEARLTDRMGTSPAGVLKQQILGQRKFKHHRTHEFMRADVVREIPLLDTASLIT